jgi:hypothetical protein
VAKRGSWGEALHLFVTLVSAVAARLVALHTSDKEPRIEGEVFANIVGGSCIGLFVVGIMSYLRMLHRNSVTDE